MVDVAANEVLVRFHTAIGEKTDDNAARLAVLGLAILPVFKAAFLEFCPVGVAVVFGQAFFGFLLLEREELLDIVEICRVIVTEQICRERTLIGIDREDGCGQARECPEQAVAYIFCAIVPTAFDVLQQVFLRGVVSDGERFGLCEGDLAF